MTTRTQGHNYNGNAGGTGGYINDDRDTGNVRLAITINKAQGQSLEKCGIDLNTDCLLMDNYYVACSRVCLWVCVLSDVMFVCRLTSCLSTDEITDRDIGTQMTTGTPGHREYK